MHEDVSFAQLPARSTSVVHQLHVRMPSVIDFQRLARAEPSQITLKSHYLMHSELMGYLKSGPGAKL